MVAPPWSGHSKVVKSASLRRFYSLILFQQNTFVFSLSFSHTFELDLCFLVVSMTNGLEMV